MLIISPQNWTSFQLSFGNEPFSMVYASVRRCRVMGILIDGQSCIEAAQLSAQGERPAALKYCSSRSSAFSQPFLSLSCKPSPHAVPESYAMAEETRS